jgi:predicted enzyme related to lactoylglutathione lyase
MLQGLRTVIYRAPELARAIKSYTEVVGHAPYFSEPFYAGFSVGSYELGLLPDAPAGPGGAQAYWGTADIEAEYARLVALGATPHHAIQDVGEGIKVAMLLDPFDNAFGLIENPHFKVENAG